MDHDEVNDRLRSTFMFARIGAIAVLVMAVVTWACVLFGVLWAVRHFT